MARINIEDSVFVRGEWLDLVLQTGSPDTALGALCRVWFVAQRYWYPKRELIPHETWEREKLNNAVIDCGFAEKTADGVYVRGSDQHFEWLFSAQKRGRKSAEARVKKYGSARPESKDSPKGHESVSKGPESVSKGHESVSKGPESVSKGHESVSKGHESVSKGPETVRSSYSYSSSSSFSKNEDGEDGEQQQPEPENQKPKPQIGMPANYAMMETSFDVEKLDPFKQVLQQMAVDFDYPKFSSSRRALVECSALFTNPDELIDWAEGNFKKARKHGLNGHEIFGNLMTELRERKSDAV